MTAVRTTQAAVGARVRGTANMAVRTDTARRWEQTAQMRWESGVPTDSARIRVVYGSFRDQLAKVVHDRMPANYEDARECC